MRRPSPFARHHLRLLGLAFALTLSTVRTTEAKAARWGDWKAVRQGGTKQIEIYDLRTDSAESKNRAGSRPDLVAKATATFLDAHRPDPSWPLDHRTEQQKQIAAKTWEHKRWRDKTGWVPKSAVQRDL